MQLPRVGHKTGAGSAARRAVSEVTPTALSRAGKESDECGWPTIVGKRVAAAESEISNTCPVENWNRF